jgi:fructosamine-3-kinase
MIDQAVSRALEAKLESRVERALPLSGGDINQAFRVELADRRVVFVKQNSSAPRSMFPAEARGLAYLAEARALRVPEVIAVSDEAGQTPAFLVLEYLEPGPRRQGFEQELGRSLAKLHRFGASNFGLDHDNFIGSLPQSNRTRQSWPEFYRRERLQPLLKLALDRGLADARLAAKFEKLFARLTHVCGPAEPPARLHGDLWGGNLHSDAAGAPVLIDPAVYAGHREVDLAMMRLFGGFGPAVFAAYQEEYPLVEGHTGRVDLYQLYPLLVHLNLFGRGYLDGVERALGRYV